MKEFVREHWDKKSPLLLAYSGGPDSKALLYALLQCDIPLHLAHIDHGWREESRREAKQLAREAEQLGLIFHHTRLEKRTTEDEARQERLRFFTHLKKEIGFQAVFLAHHADDLAETALKRVLEGAHLTRLYGMRPESVNKGLLLWRPLLNLPKREIEIALQMQSLSFFRDPSNHDERYLRGKMRVSLLPFLESSFGKAVRGNLSLLAERSRELDDYLAKRLESAQAICRGPFGVQVDGQGLERLELRYMIQRVLAEESLTLSKDLLEMALDWMAAGKTNRKLFASGRKMIVDRNRFFLLQCNLPQFGAATILPSWGNAQSGDWLFEIVEGTAEERGWFSLWSGSGSFLLPPEGVVVDLPPTNFKIKDKCPAFLKKICPLIFSEDKINRSFLTPRKNVAGKIVKIFIKPNANEIR